MLPLNAQKDSMQAEACGVLRFHAAALQMIKSEQHKVNFRIYYWRQYKTTNITETAVMQCIKADCDVWLMRAWFFFVCVKKDNREMEKKQKKTFF